MRRYVLVQLPRVAGAAANAAAAAAAAAQRQHAIAAAAAAAAAAATAGSATSGARTMVTSSAAAAAAWRGGWRRVVRNTTTGSSGGLFAAWCAATIAGHSPIGAAPRRAISFAAAAPAAKAFVQARYFAVLGAGAAAAALTATASDASDAVTAAARTGGLAAVRLARDVATAAAIVADYKLSLRGAPASGPERDAILSACHARGAERLLRLCFANGGIYTKLGQHLGQLDHLVPPEYVATMRAHLLDRCPVSSYDEVAAIVAEDLGAPPEELFAEFARDPIASASLAQVHEARSKDGRRLAVKVQHAGLRESCDADIRTVEALVRGARAVFPDFNYQWLVDEIKENLPKELDFRHEAANAERCRRNLASPRSRVRRRVHVPDVDRALTSRRVLTMEFIDGARVTDAEALRARGISRRGLARLVAEAFNEMVFIHGDVHCDPHAANLLARKGPDGRDQLVLLDHGLYRVIDDALRAEYAGLWRALVFGDAAGIKAHAAAMGAGDLYPLFAAMLTQRPWEAIVDRRLDHLDAPKTAADRALLQGYAMVYVREIGDLLLRMPRPLLLLLKTNDCLRAVDAALGSPLSAVAMTARECTRALSEMRSAQRPGLRSWLAGAADAAHVEAVVAAMGAMAWWAWLRRAVFGGGGARGGGGGGGEKQKQQQAAAEEPLPPLQALPAEFVAATTGAPASRA